VLSLLRDVGEPITATDAARRLGLHANTVRFHLETLEESGLVTRQPEERSGPGRPRLLYSATPAGSAAEGRSYRFLAEVLTGFLAEKVARPAKAAEEAGQAWGRFLTEPPAPYEKVAEPAALSALVDNLDQIGFVTRPVDDEDGLRLEVSHCPFLEVAEKHSDVVCSVHLGLMKGMLSELRAPVSAKRLEPMVEPSRCIARLARH
jgi:predicted ArsR family transcriptional regulator